MKGCLFIMIIKVNSKISRVITIMLIITLLLLACNNNKETIMSPNRESSRVPVYIGAINIKHYELQADLTMGVSYEMKLPYPGSSEVVLSYYDDKMKQAGYEPYVEEYYSKGARKWHEFIDGSIKGEPLVAQFNASWADKKYSKRANLVLKYKWYIENKTPPYVIPSNDKLLVDFRVMPFVEAPPPMVLPSGKSQ